ncbi:hypothetical protein [Salinivibrio sp. IB872]|jgi:hypothetical protein|uniref:hypothetical protein n=1 Tax=Salinivibrio sp. IB872 TaxID=1766123 RepID=UPI0009840ED5|nr:hypothetical protein [Salinivibrio sp. IB872]OOF29557.1 hypothetical protein BZJ18_00720 [Salinivibrio sp. IB872]
MAFSVQPDSMLPDIGDHERAMVEQEVKLAVTDVNGQSLGYLAMVPDAQRFLTLTQDTNEALSFIKTPCSVNAGYYQWSFFYDDIEYGLDCLIDPDRNKCRLYANDHAAAAPSWKLGYDKELGPLMMAAPISAIGPGTRVAVTSEDASVPKVLVGALEGGVLVREEPN